MELYGEDGRVRVYGDRLRRGPTLERTHTVDDSTKIAALSTRHAVDEQWPRHWASGKWRGPTHRLKAFDNERFGQELSELHHLELVVPVGAEASRRLPTPGAASQGKRRSWNRVSDRHPLLHRSSSSRSGGSLGATLGASGRWSVETA